MAAPGNRVQDGAAEMNEPLVVVHHELADMLRVSSSALYRMRRESLVPDPMPGSGARWARAEIAAWLAAGSPPAAEWRLIRREALAPQAVAH